MSLSTSSCSGLSRSILRKGKGHHQESDARTPTLLQPSHHLTSCLGLGCTAMFGTKDILNKTIPDLLDHALGLLHRLLDVLCHLRSHTLEVDVVAFRHISNRRRRVYVRAAGGSSVDGRLHDLHDQSKALKLSSGQKYRLFGLSGSSLCR